MLRWGLGPAPPSAALTPLTLTAAAASMRLAERSGLPACLPAGLPEEVSHTKQALARGYAVLAVDSKDRDPMSRCYS